MPQLPQLQVSQGQCLLPAPSLDSGALLVIPGAPPRGHITHSASPSHGVSPFSFSKKVYLFIFGYAGSSLLPGLSLVAESGGYSLVAEHGLRTVGASLRSTGSRVCRLPELWRTGLVALRPVGSS